jgi:hypothetical protein
LALTNDICSDWQGGNPISIIGSPIRTKDVGCVGLEFDILDKFISRRSFGNPNVVESKGTDMEK